MQLKQLLKASFPFFGLILGVCCAYNLAEFYLSPNKHFGNFYLQIGYNTAIALLVLCWTLSVLYLFLGKKMGLVWFLKWICLPLLLLYFYGFSVVFRCNEMYYALKHQERGWKGTPYRSHSLLGYTNKPNARLLMTFRGSKTIASYHNAQGFRCVAADTNQQTTDVALAFLGCSYTYADACIAEQSFAHATAKTLNMKYLNAGTCSYGLAQMVAQARAIVPKHKPKFLVVEYAPWLVTRAQQMYAPSYFGKVPTPYFDENAKLVKPAFLPEMDNLGTEKFQNSTNNVVVYGSFLLKIGLPYFYKNDLNVLKTWCKTTTGMQPKPNQNGDQIKTQVFSEIQELCCKNNCKLIVWGISDNEMLQKPTILDSLHILFLNTDSLLNPKNEFKTYETYLKKYGHWQKNSPTDSSIIDVHPNATAHQIIAAGLVGLLRKTD